MIDVDDLTADVYYGGRWYHFVWSVVEATWKPSEGGDGVGGGSKVQG